jgi:hypothetical protein
VTLKSLKIFDELSLFFLLPASPMAPVRIVRPMKFPERPNATISLGGPFGSKSASYQSCRWCRPAATEELSSERLEIFDQGLPLIGSEISPVQMTNIGVTDLIGIVAKSNALRF